jgi:hypothetical protein
LHRPERALDIIILYDSHDADIESLKRADEYMYRNKLNLPKLAIHADKNEYCKKSMTVMNDPREESYQSRLPTVLYFPTLGMDLSKSPYVTFNFKYTAQEIDDLVTATAQAFYDNFSAIKDIMQAIAIKKY